MRTTETGTWILRVHRSRTKVAGHGGREAPLPLAAEPGQVPVRVRVMTKRKRWKRKRRRRRRRRVLLGWAKPGHGLHSWRNECVVR